MCNRFHIVNIGAWWDNGVSLTTLDFVVSVTLLSNFILMSVLFVILLHQIILLLEKKFSCVTDKELINPQVFSLHLPRCSLDYYYHCNLLDLSSSTLCSKVCVMQFLTWTIKHTTNLIVISVTAKSIRDKTAIIDIHRKSDTWPSV